MSEVERGGGGVAMFYGERIEDCQIVERGIFLSLEEFADYRRKGWSASKEINALAEDIIAEQDQYAICGEKE